MCYNLSPSENFLKDALMEAWAVYGWVYSNAMGLNADRIFWNQYTSGGKSVNKAPPSGPTVKLTRSN